MSGKTVWAVCAGLLLAGCGEGREQERRARTGTSAKTQAARDAARMSDANTSTTQPARPARPETQPTQPAPATTQATQATQATRGAAVTAEAMEAKLGRVVELEKQGEFAEAWRAALEARSALAGSPRLAELNQVMGRLREEKRQAAELGGAIGLLASPTAEASQIAASELAGGGEVGMLLLRRAVRAEPPATAERAARVLVRLNDAGAPEAFCRRLKDAPPEPLRSTLLEGLAALAGRIPPTELRGLYESVKGADFAAERKVLAVLAAAYRKSTDGEAGKFARWVGDAGAVEKLRALAAKGLESKNPAQAEEAAAIVADLGMMLRGLRGSYYDGRDFSKLLFERLDEKVDIPNGKLPYPDGRQTDRSVRWAGQIRIVAPGEYTFYLTCDDGGRLWVGDKQILNEWRDQGAAEFIAKLPLAKGLHAVKLEYYQGQGEGSVQLGFQGPGIDKQLLGPEHLACPPWVPAGGAGDGKKPK